MSIQMIMDNDNILDLDESKAKYIYMHIYMRVCVYFYREIIYTWKSSYVNIA